MLPKPPNKKGMKHLWYILIATFAVSRISVAVTVGTYFEDISASQTDTLPRSTSNIDIHMYFHKCSIIAICNFVVKDKRTNEYDMYATEDEFSVNSPMLRVWKKVKARYVYKVVEESINWQDARRKCKSLGGDLASIGSKKAEDEIKKVLAGYLFETLYWFGLNDLKKEGEYVWSDGTKSSYTNWANLEPASGTGKNCMVSGGPMQWFMASCTLTVHPVCHVPVL